jgi:hypothetical protein
MPLSIYEFRENYIRKAILSQGHKYNYIYVCEVCEYYVAQDTFCFLVTLM